VQRTSGAPGRSRTLRLRERRVRCGATIRSSSSMAFVCTLNNRRSRNGNLASSRATSDTAISTGHTRHHRHSTTSIRTSSRRSKVLRGRRRDDVWADAANGVIVITTKRASRVRRAERERGARPDADGRRLSDAPLPVGTRHLRRGPVTVRSQHVGGVPCVGDSVRTFQLLSDPALTVLDKAIAPAPRSASRAEVRLSPMPSRSYKERAGS